MYPPVYQKLRLLYVTDFVQTPDFHKHRLQHICVLPAVSTCLDVGLQLSSYGFGVFVIFVEHTTYCALIAHIALNL